MSWLSFIAGAGAGAFTATALLLWIMARSSGKNAKWNAVTVRLMNERNELDRAKVAKLTTLAEWCEKHWS